MPDPQDPATFERSKLSRDGDPELRAFYADLLELRRGLPREVETQVEGDVLRLRRGRLEAVLDFGARTVEVNGRAAEAWPGMPFPLGPTWDGEGTNFSIFSEGAERVELCLFDDERRRDEDRGARPHGLQLALLPARRRARPALRLPHPRAATTRAPADGSTRRSC